MNSEQIKLYNNVFEELQKLHEQIDDFYDYTSPHNKYESNLYEALDDQYKNVLLSLKELIKGGNE